MKKQLVIIGIVALLVCVGLSGCESNPLISDKDKFVGTWQTSGGLTYVFFSNGTSNYDIIHGTWEIKDGLLFTTVNGLKVTTIDGVTKNLATHSYVFSNGDRTLTLTGTTGATMTFTKQ
jgi:hypothetical protein